MAKIRRYTQEENDFLRENYRNGNVEYCAEYLGRSVASVKGHALRVLKINISKDYTQEEIEFIEEHSKMPNGWIAEQLGRSKSSVRRKRADENIEKQEEARDMELTVMECVRLTGLHKTTLQTWVKKKKIKSTRVGKYRYVKINNLKNFLKNNPDKWDATKCEEWYFQNEEWFREKLKADSLKKRQKRWGEYYEVI